MINMPAAQKRFKDGETHSTGNMRGKLSQNEILRIGSRYLLASCIKLQALRPEKGNTEAKFQSVLCNRLTRQNK